MGIAGLIEYAMWRRLRATPIFMRAEAPKGLRSRASRLGLMFLFRAGLLVLFLAIATVIFLIFFDEDGKVRIAFFFYLSATGIFRLAYAFSHSFCAPEHPSLRLPSFSDADARSIMIPPSSPVRHVGAGSFPCAAFWKPVPPSKLR